MWPDTRWGAQRPEVLSMRDGTSCPGQEWRRAIETQDKMGRGVGSVLEEKKLRGMENEAKQFLQQR